MIKAKGRIIQLTIIYLVLIVTFIYFASPLLWLIFSAFDPEASVEFKVPKNITMKWFLALVEPIGGAYAEVTPIMWIINSLIIAFSTAVLVTILSIMGGYSLSRYRFRGQSALLNAFVILRLMPPMVVAIPIVIIYAKIGLLNTYLGIVIVLTALILPFTLLIADGYFKSIPIEYEEAAMIDGCSRFRAFVKVTLPLALPGIVTIWLMSFVIAWGEFLMPLVILRSPYMYPASVGIYYWFGAYGRVEYGRISAFSLVYSIPTIVVFLVTRRYLTKGIAGLVTR